MDPPGPKAEGPCMRLGASNVLFFTSYDSRHGGGNVSRGHLQIVALNIGDKPAGHKEIVP